MKFYSYLIIALTVLAVSYLTYEDWNTRPKLVIFFVLLGILNIYREIKDLRKS